MPKKRCVVNSNNKNKIPYVYYATKYYRNEKGASITERISIGKKDEGTGMLIPNDNFFDIYDCEVNVVVKGVKQNVEK